MSEEKVFDPEPDDHVVETTDSDDLKNEDTVTPVDDDGAFEEPPDPDDDIPEDEGDAGQPGGVLLLDGEDE